MAGSDPSFPVEALFAAEPRVDLAYRGQVDPGVLRMRTRHPFYTWWWVLSGEARLETADERYVVAPGQWVLIPPNLERAHDIDAGTQLLSLSVTWNWPFGGPVLDVGAVRVVEARQTPRLCRYAHLAIDRLGVASPPPRPPVRTRMLGAGQWHRFRSALHAFLGELTDVALSLGGSINPPQTVDPRLRHVLRDLSERPTAGPLPYERWRPLVGVGRVQIDRLARQHLGMSLHDWRDRQLAREVRRRLIADTAVIKTVAAELGFVDSAHFHRWVKKHLGLIPSEVRGRAV